MIKDKITNAIFRFKKRFQKDYLELELARAIVQECYIAMDSLDAGVEYLCVLGSYGDTLDSTMVLEELKELNSGGSTRKDIICEAKFDE